jgi:hypothetical protein
MTNDMLNLECMKSGKMTLRAKPVDVELSWQLNKTALEVASKAACVVGRA